MDTEIPMMQYQPSSSSSISNSTNVVLQPYGSHNNNNAINNSNSNTNNNNTNNSHLYLQNELQVVRYAGRQAVCNFLTNHNCLSILKVSTKIIVFDIQTPIQLRSEERRVGKEC